MLPEARGHIPHRNLCRSVRAFSGGLAVFSRCRGARLLCLQSPAMCLSVCFSADCETLKLWLSSLVPKVLPSISHSMLTRNVQTTLAMPANPAFGRARTSGSAQHGIPAAYRVQAAEWPNLISKGLCEQSCPDLRSLKDTLPLRPPKTCDKLFLLKLQPGNASATCSSEWRTA